MNTYIRGAEAIVEDATYLGRAVVAKIRQPKPYRHPMLDAQIRAERTRDEANLLIATRRAGVPVPIVYDIDRAQATLLLQRIEGLPLRAVLESDEPAVAAARMETLGDMVARMHDAGITHGDLTTSNILVPDNANAARLVLIDFGLGQATQEDEPRAVDLHLMEEALEATHAAGPQLMEAMLVGYARTMTRQEHVLRRLEGVRERGRYRGAA